MKKRYVWIGAGAVALIAAVVAILVLRSPREKWVTLRDMPGYEDFSYDSIEKISLREYVSSPYFAVFEDEDLIAPWRDYFKSVKLRPDTGAAAWDPSLVGGGPPVAVVTAGGKEYSFLVYPGECKLSPDDNVYVTNSSDCPFEATFREAVERHGSTTPWD